jgi:hypothetical protein
MPGQAHVSMTTIEHISGTDSLKVLVRIDYNLFLRDYQQSINDDLDLNILRSYKPFPPEMAGDYINSKIRIYINKELLPGKLLKTRLTGNEITLNILYTLKPDLKTLTVRNTLLEGLFSDVENLTIIKLENFESGIKFTKQHNEETFILSAKEISTFLPEIK